MDIKTDFIPVGRGNRPGRQNPCDWVTIHNTGNFALSANAKSHANYLKGNDAANAPVSWHYTVDKDEICQHLPDDEDAFHAGDGSGPGNRTSIGVEICVNFGFVPSNPAGITQTGIRPQSQATQTEINNARLNFALACSRAAALVAELLKRHKLSIDHVVQHNRWSGKNCPMQIRTGDWGATWAQFLELVKEQIVPTPPPIIYRVRKSWQDAVSQIGAFVSIDNAILLADQRKNDGFKVFDPNGKVVHDPTGARPVNPPTASPQPVNPAKIIWDFLRGKGLNDFAIAGLMGNLFAESGLKSNILQHTFKKTLGHTDESYTAAVDDGTYANFVRDKAGYGLAQWTFWSRKEALLAAANAAKVSIGDFMMQLDFLWKEIQGYPGVMKVLNTASSVREASDVVLIKYESPADQSERVQLLRASYGQTYYDKFAAPVIAGDNPSEWAFEAWEWGVRHGIIHGDGPTNIVTKEEVVQMLYNFTKI